MLRQYQMFSLCKQVLTFNFSVIGEACFQHPSLFASGLALRLFPHSTSEKYITKASENPVPPLWHPFYFMPSILKAKLISFLKEPRRMPWRSKYFRLFQRTVFILSSQDVMSLECPSRSLLFLGVVMSRRCAGAAYNGEVNSQKRSGEGISRGLDTVTQMFWG